ncbi:MAG: DUF502 domain-containing protein [Verrucomicrobia bacterium]|nr:DUF502 domain-containing protein [Verrucomicrobiota bacterium]
MRKYLITGLIILLPLALTIFVIVFLFDFFTTPFVPVVNELVALIQKKLPFLLPEGFAIFLSRLLSLLMICALILLLGMFGRWFFIESFLKWTNKLINRIPIIRSVYKISKEVISALFSQDGKKVFKEPVMLPFPDKPNFCIGFSSGEAPAECEEKMGRKLVSVFAPTAPHPISGFLFILPEDEVKEIDMTNEDAVKFLVSCGVILPAAEAQEAQDDF